MKTKKKSGKILRKSGKSQGKIREFDGIKKVGTLTYLFIFQINTILNSFYMVFQHSNLKHRLRFFLDTFSQLYF